MLLELIFVELSTLILRVGLRLLASLFCGSFVLFAFFTARNEITIEKAEAITDNIILIIFNKSTFNHLKYNITIKRKEFQYAWRNNQKNAFRARLVLL